jgi:hypothetical protein
MDLEVLNREIEEFSKSTHGSSDYDNDLFFVRGANLTDYAPLKYLVKKIPDLKAKESLLEQGYVSDSFELFSFEHFQTWFEKQFSRKMSRSKDIHILHMPNNKSIFNAIETVHKCYEVLRKEYIIQNGKNLPVQLGEWYAKCIFGMGMRKSASQRGFDFYIGDKRVEVKVHWADNSSPKGVKIRKSLVELSDYSIIMYIARNFMIREICFLDSSFILRKFSTKGHTIFLKDADISSYFFSKSSKHLDKVANKTLLMKYASPNFALKLSE